MKQQITNSRKPLADSSPLFASVWLALFHSLREHYASRNEDQPGMVSCPEPDLD